MEQNLQKTYISSTYRKAFLLQWAESIGISRDEFELESLFNLYSGMKNPIKLAFGKKYTILSMHQKYVKREFSYRFEILEKLMLKKS